jgi:hypothetical protein
MPPWSLADLAAQPRWDSARTRALPGRCVGSLLRDWGLHVRRRWGEDALAAVRERAGLDAATLPDAPSLTEWVPLHYQLALTEAVADECLGGDLLALEALLHADALAARDRLLRWAIAKLGPAAALKGAGKLHPHLYDVGRVTSRVRRGQAELAFDGAALFGHPTWRLLQLFGQRSLLRALKRELLVLEGDDRGSDAFALRLAWR